MAVFKPSLSQRYYDGSAPDPSVKCASNFLHLFTEIRAWNNEDITKHTLRRVDWYISTGTQSRFASYITHVTSERSFFFIGLIFLSDETEAVPEILVAIVKQCCRQLEYQM